MAARESRAERFDEEPRGAPAPVVRNPGVWGGKAVIAGTRLPVFLIQQWMEGGWTVDDLLSAHPHLTEAQVQGALAYCAEHPERVREDREAYHRTLPAEPRR